ncbi:MAG: acyl-CoA dehydrogenase, partial [Aliifodinibius sp.]|nr:acyl-CoA dehydrogenase [Fodinibius sp.]
MSTDVLEKATGLSFELSEEQQLIRDSIKDFVERHVKPDVKERDASKEFPHDLVKKLADQGFMGMVHPEKYGGGGVGHVSFCLAIEE